MVTLDVKPWDDETDMVELEKGVRAIGMDGLLWGQSKLVPVGFGIKKLQVIYRYLCYYPYVLWKILCNLCLLIHLRP